MKPSIIIIKRYPRQGAAPEHLDIHQDGFASEADVEATLAKARQCVRQYRESRREPGIQVASVNVGELLKPLAGG